MGSAGVPCNVKLFSGSWFDSGSEFDSLFKMCSPGMMTDDVITDTVPGTVVGPSGMVLDGIFADTVPATVVCSSGMVLDGIFVDRFADQDSAAACGDSSSAAASKHAISIGSRVSNKDLHSDEYAVCGSRLIKMESTLSQNGIGNGSNVQVFATGSVVVQVRIWTFLVSGSAKCVTLRGVGLLGSDAIGVMLLVIRFQTTFPWVLWDGHPHSPRSSGPPSRSSAPRHVPPRSTGAVSGPSPGAGVGPSPGNVEAEKKVETNEMLQALSLLQRIMSPEDFVKYQVLVAPPKPGKTREQELADRVKSPATTSNSGNDA